MNERGQTGPELEAREVAKEFPGGVIALTGIDLAVARGETLALIGESGSGKTTLLRLFNRMIEPTRGEVRIRGRAAGAADPIELRRSTGYVQQDGGLLPHWTVGRNVGLVPGLLGWDAGRRRRRVRELLDLVGLPPDRFHDRHPSALSGGQRQRVAFARALAADPPVVLLDEPFGALDAITRVELHEEFLRLRGQIDKTMVMVTHDLGEAFLLAGRIAVLKDRRILRIGTPAELEEQPGDEYVERLLAHRTGGMA